MTLKALKAHKRTKTSDAARSLAEKKRNVSKENRGKLQISSFKQGN